MDLPSRPTEHVQILPPPPSLSRFIVCCLWRRVEAGAGAAAGSTLPGHVPANVYGCLNIIEGQGRVLVPAAAPAQLPAVFVTGPFTAPLLTQAMAPLHSLSIVFQPWLLPDWLGLAAPQMVNAIQDLTALPPHPGFTEQHRQRLVQCMASPDAVFEALAANLATLPEPPEPAPSPEAYAAAALAAPRIAEAARAVGVSERQFERQFERWFGVLPKTWLRIKRFEDALTQLASEDAQAHALSLVAADAGYADQSHMTREFRSISGNTPLTLRRGVQGRTPGYWAFQPAGAAGMRR